MKSRAGSKPIEVDRIVMAADAGMLDPGDLLRRGPAHAGEGGFGEEILVEHEIGRARPSAAPR